TNIVGFANILEFSQRFGIKHLIYASSSSVYGQYEGPAKVSASVDQPLSLYAATKRSNELLAQTYCKMHGLPTTGLRFFTVYGPWGRPDAAYYLFTNALRGNESFQLYNYGQIWRDFTYIDDVVEGITRTVFQKPVPQSKIFNLGTGHPVQMTEFVQKLATICGKEAQIEKVAGHPEDIRFSCADTSELFKNFGFKPAIPLQTGLTEFVRWYDEYTQADQPQPS
ncbi:MAG: NAD-dependent epimerase/dehydratase family protein, partial [Bacteroidota bacterium]